MSGALGYPYGQVDTSIYRPSAGGASGGLGLFSDPNGMFEQLLRMMYMRGGFGGSLGQLRNPLVPTARGTGMLGTGSAYGTMSPYMAGPMGQPQPPMLMLPGSPGQ